KNLSYGLKSQDANIQNIVLGLLGNTITAAANANTKSQAGKASLSSTGIKLPSLVPLLKQFSPDIEKQDPQGTVKFNVNSDFDLRSKEKPSNVNGTIDLDSIGVT